MLSLIQASTRESLGLTGLALLHLSLIESPDANRISREIADDFKCRLEPRITDADLADLLSADPVLTIVGLASVRDEKVRETTIRTYHGLLNALRGQGLSPFSDANAHLAQTALHIFHGGPPPAEIEPVFPASLDSHALARFALQLSWFGRRHVSLSTANLLPVLQALLLLRGRKRDLPEMALVAIAISCLFPDTEIEDFTAWARRLRRSDGSFGVWQLFPDSSRTALVRSSSLLAYSLSLVDRIRDRGYVVAFEGEDVKIGPSREEVESALRRCSGWVTDNVAHFHLLQGCRDQDDFGDRIKPLVELLLMLWLVRTTAEKKGCSWLKDWVDAVSVPFEAYLRWEGLTEALRIFPTSVLVALAVPLLEQLTGRSSPARAEIKAIIEDSFAETQERIPMRQMDYWFMRWLFEPTPEARAQIQAVFDRTLLAGASNPMLFSNDSLYDVTHAVFYGTCFGQWTLPLSPRQTVWSRKYIPRLALASTLDGDFDLGAEFILCCRYLRRDESTIEYRLATQQMVGAVSVAGSVEAPAGLKDAELKTEFQKVYHTTLVVLAALAELL